MDAERGFSTRAGLPEDAPALSGIFNRAFNKQKDERTLLWKYFACPHGEAITLVASGKGDGESAPRSGGAYSYVLRKMTWRGRPFLACQAADAMVDAEFRRRGIFTTLDDEAARQAAERGAPVSFATAGRQSMRGFLGNGWRETGTHRTYIALLEPARLLEGVLPRALARAAGAAARPLLRLLGRLPRSSRPDARVRPVERFDARADSLWERCREGLPIAGARDSAFLNWRFLDTPTRKHRALALERGAEWDGYAVVEDGGGRGWVVDLLAENEEAEDALLRAALLHLRERGNPLVFVSALPCARLVRLLRRNGLFPHPRKRPFRTSTPFIVRLLREDLEPPPQVLADPTQWYLLDGDRDVEHMSPE